MRQTMRIVGGVLLLVLVIASLASAQPVRVVSEFLRFTPTGEYFPQDGVEYPVEVLSPALVRGVWNSFRIVVDVDPGETFRLYVAQNPANAMQTRALREVVERGAAGWRISRREPAVLPFRSSQIPEAERSASRTNYTFWFDIRPPADYPSRRLKLEAQLLLNNQWFVYPLELRVTELEAAGVPPDPETSHTATLLAQTADVPYRKVVERMMCGGDPPVVPPESPLELHAARVFEITVRAAMDVTSEEEVISVIESALRIKDRGGWCKAPTFPVETFGAEWPAALRNRILGLAGDPE